MKYADLVKVYSALEDTPKRLAKTKILSEFLVGIPSSDLEACVLLLQGKLFPAWDDRKIGIASRLVVKALHTATGSSTAAIEKEWKKTGDLGLVAEHLVTGKKQATLFSTSLTVGKVFSNLQKLASLEGHGTIAVKMQYISELLTSASSLEAKYIVRTLLEDLRIGVGEGSFRDAIVWGFFGKKLGISYDAKEHEISLSDREEYNSVVGIVQHALDVSNDFGVVVKAASKGLKALESVDMQVFNPIKVMLALKVEGISEGFERCGTPAAAEYKLDGFRLQIHKDKGEVRLFTRRLENVTTQFPDVVSAVLEHCSGTSFILDAEAVGFDVKTKQYLPFQHVSQRIRRKYGIEEMIKKLPVEVNVFDVLAYDGDSLLGEPFEKRRKIAEKIVKDVERSIVVVDHVVSSDSKKIDAFYKKSLASGNEGIMMKKLDAPYKPGARVGYMVKVKPVMDTLDLVIVGAEWGEGKRAAWLSSFTLACKDGDSYLEIGKMGTGIKEKEGEGVTFKQLTSLLKPLIVSEEGKSVVVKPKIVIEVNYEEIQKSPTYSSGYALRFPRLVGVRDDRKAADCSTLAMVKQYFKGQ